MLYVGEMKMVEKAEVVGYGVLGLGVVTGLYFLARGIGKLGIKLPELPQLPDLLPDLSGNMQKMYDEWVKAYDAQKVFYEDLIAGMKITSEEQSKRYGDLNKWYEDAIAQINSLTQQLGEAEYKLATGAKVTVSEGFKNFGQTIEEIIEAGKSTTYQIPGWMPRGEV